MKKILLLLMLVSTNILAKTEVPIVWPFSLDVTYANQIREIILQSNQSQSKYYFVLQHRPGASGVVATKHVGKTDQISILAHNPNFFINIYKSKEKLYSEDQFSMINVMCDEIPFALVSKRYQNLKEIPTDTNLSVGLVPGIQDLVFYNISTQMPFRSFAVPHNNVNQININLTGGHIDAMVSWISISKANGFHVLGITGRSSREGFRTFESQGIKHLGDINVTFYFFVKSDVPEDVKKEISQILGKAIVSARSTEWCQIDHGKTGNVVYPNTNSIMLEKSKFWQQKIETHLKFIDQNK